MSLNELNEWLVSEGIREDVDALVRITVRSELDNIASDSIAEELPIDWPQLMLAGSLLARSDLRAHQETALRIATGAITLENSQPIRDAGAVLLDKLSNSRAVILALSRDLIVPDLDERLGMTLRMEMQRRQIDNSVLIESSGQWLPVNDFQQRFWNSAGSHSWLSA
ncbi:MAG: hypothetical protein IPG54_13795 [Sphingomonadales bacterium]|nr:hypothetical protein [Sphingomonadales bacterium]